MIQFIHENIYKKETKSPVNNLLEMTLIYSEKKTHIYIYTSDDNPKYFFKDQEEEG